MSAALLVFGFIGGVLWLWLTRANLRLAVWLVLLWVPVQGWFQLNVFNDSNLTVLIYEVMLLGIYLVFALRFLKTPERLAPPPVVWWAAPFLVWSLLLIPYSLSQTGVVLTLIGLRTFLLTLPLLWIGYHAFATRRQLEIVAVLVALEFVVIGAITASQFLGFTSMSGRIFRLPVGYTAPYFVIRPPGTFSQPGLLGHYALFGIPFAIGLLGLNARFWPRVCYAAGLGGITVALLANTNRASIVLLAVALPLMIVLVRRGRTLMMAAMATCVMAGAALLSGTTTLDAFRLRVESISYDAENTLVTSPLYHIQDALREPALGSGLGIASPGVGRLEGVRSLDPTAMRPDSIKFGESFVASLLFETGAPGLAFYLIFLGAILCYSLKALRACRGSDMELLAAGIFAVQVALILYSWSYGPLKLVPSRVLFWFWTGVLFRLPQMAVARAAVHRSMAAVRQPAERMAAAIADRAARPRLAATSRRAG